MFCPQELNNLGVNATMIFEVACSNETACYSIDAAAEDLLASTTCDLIIVAAGLTADARSKNAAEGGSNACGCPQGWNKKTAPLIL